MKIRLFGSNGMLGGMVFREAINAGHSVSFNGGDEDITQPLTASLSGFDAAINCAGLVKQVDAPASRFMQVNAVAPHLLAEQCDAAGVRLIQVSTDCVFTQPGPHDEEAQPTPGDLYGRSKLAGEVTCAPHLTLRTSFIGYGKRGLLADLFQGKPQRASRYLRWNGHTVDTVASMLVLLATRPEISGVLHMPGEEQNRYQLVMSLLKHFGLSTDVIEDNSFVADRRLVSRRWHALNLPRMRYFDDQLRNMRCPV